MRTAQVEEDNAPVEETALEKAVLALTILSKKKWQGGCSRGGPWPTKGGPGGIKGGENFALQ